MKKNKRKNGRRKECNTQRTTKEKEDGQIHNNPETHKEIQKDQKTEQKKNRQTERQEERTNERTHKNTKDNQTIANKRKKEHTQARKK